MSTSTPVISRESIADAMHDYVSAMVDSLDELLPLVGEVYRTVDGRRKAADKVLSHVGHQHLQLASAVLDDRIDCPVSRCAIAIAVQEAGEFVQAVLAQAVLDLPGPVPLTWMPERLHLALTGGRSRSKAIRELVEERVDLLAEELKADGKELYWEADRQSYTP